MKRIFPLTCFILLLLSCNKDTKRSFSYSEDNYNSDRKMIINDACLPPSLKNMYINLIDSVFWENRAYQSRKIDIPTLHSDVYQKHKEKWSKSSIELILEDIDYSNDILILSFESEDIYINLSSEDRACGEIEKILLHRYILYEIFKERNNSLKKIFKHSNDLYLLI